MLPEVMTVAGMLLATCCVRKGRSQTVTPLLFCVQLTETSLRSIWLSFATTLFYQSVFLSHMVNKESKQIERANN